SWVPDDQLPDSSRFEDHWLGVSLFGIGRQSPPNLLPGHFVESHHFGVRLAAYDGDQAITIDQWRARNSPGRHLHSVVLYVIFLPDQIACLGVEAEQDTASPDDVNSLAINGRRRARPCGVADASVVRVPFARPNDFAGLLIQTKSAFGPFHSTLDFALDFIGPFEVGHEYASRGHGRTREAAV